MVWQGINLTQYHQQRWLKKSIKHLILTLFFIILMMIIAITFFFLSKEVEHNKKIALKENEEQQQAINLINHKIAQIQSQSITKGNNDRLSTENILFLLDYIANFNIQGSIGVIQLSKDKTVKLKLSGRLSHQNDFETIEKQLKTLSYPYQIDHFQTNDIHHIEFGFTLDLGENNEKDIR